MSVSREVGDRAVTRDGRRPSRGPALPGGVGVWGVAGGVGLAGDGSALGVLRSPVTFYAGARLAGRVEEVEQLLLDRAELGRRLQRGVADGEDTARRRGGGSAAGAVDST